MRVVIIYSTFFKTKKSKRRASKLTATRINIYAPTHADRTLNPSLLQYFLERHRPLTVCCFAVIAFGGVEGNLIDMSQQPLES